MNCHDNIQLHVDLYLLVNTFLWLRTFALELSKVSAFSKPLVLSGFPLIFSLSPLRLHSYAEGIPRSCFIINEVVHFLSPGIQLITQWNDCVQSGVLLYFLFEMTAAVAWIDLVQGTFYAVVLPPDNGFKEDHSSCDHTNSVWFRNSALSRIQERTECADSL